MAQDGEMHLFGISWRNKDGTNPNVDRFLDLWHNSTTDGGQTWQQAQVVYPGNIAGQSFPTQLPSGRIVYPIPDWVANRPSEPPTGEMEVTSIHSDDGGGTWNVSASRPWFLVIRKTFRR